MPSEPISPTMKTTMTSTTKKEPLGIDGNPKDRGDRVIWIKHILHFDETIFFDQVVYNRFWGIVVGIMLTGVIAYVARFNSLLTFDANDTLEQLVDDDSERGKVISMVVNDGVLIGEVLVGMWIKCRTFWLWGIIIERKIDNLWFARWTKNNIFWLLLDGNN
jgi:hypothetical protein